VSFSEILWLREGKATQEEEDAVEDMAADVIEEEGSDTMKGFKHGCLSWPTVIPC
jgi:hypothetical protein